MRTREQARVRNRGSFCRGTLSRNMRSAASATLKSKSYIYNHTRHRYRYVMAYNCSIYAQVGVTMGPYCLLHTCRTSWSTQYCILHDDTADRFTTVAGQKLVRTYTTNSSSIFNYDTTAEWTRIVDFASTARCGWSCCSCR